MTLVRIENMFLNGLIPSGKRLYFQCVRCGKEIKVRSLWRNLLALPGCLIFVIVVSFFPFSFDWRVGLFVALLAYFPLVLLFEIITRIRYPSVSGFEGGR
jgi:hypothetical protein